MNNLKKVIYLGSKEGYEASAEVLVGIANVVHIEAIENKVADELKDSDALIDASMRVKITDEMIAQSRFLKIISCATTGSDHIARNKILEKDIAIRTLKEDPHVLANITPAAELSWALLMACARKIPAALNHTKQGQWIREEFPGMMLNGKTLGLIGCGRIGGWMARYAKAFGLSVIGVDPYIENWPDGIKKATLEDIAKESDFISIHVHLSDETKGLVSREFLKSTKKGVILINTSRGAIIDEDALLDGLQSGQVGAVGLDVLEGEPDIKNHPLIKYSQNHNNVLITPHCGGFSPDAVRVVCRHAASKVAQEFLEKEK